MNDSIPVNKFTLCQTTDTVNFLVDEFPLGQTSFHFSGFFECLLLHFFFLGVFLGGNGGGVGIAWLSQRARLGMESRAPLSGVGMVLTLCHSGLRMILAGRITFSDTEQQV